MAALPSRSYQLTLQEFTGLALAFQDMRVVNEPQFAVEFNGATWTGALPRLTSASRPNAELFINIPSHTVALMHQGTQQAKWGFTM